MRASPSESERRPNTDPQPPSPKRSPRTNASPDSQPNHSFDPKYLDDPRMPELRRRYPHLTPGLLAAQLEYVDSL